MIIIHNNAIPETASVHDPIEAVAVRRLLTPSTLPVIEQGKMPFVNWARIPAGQSFRSHHHGDHLVIEDPAIGMSEFFVIVEGEGDFTGGNRTEHVTTGNLIYIPRGELHSLKNTTNKDLIYICFGISTGGGTFIPE